jgi:hypothetical protein
MAHIFFASYARLDNDKKRLRNVILDLRERVRGKLGAANAADVGFFDQVDGILTGQVWQDVLGEAARHANVLVCFCSNTYFNSEYCANEFDVFRRRLNAAGAAATALRVVIPVVWDVGVVPQAVSKYQDSDEGSKFPTDYRQQGLLALKRNKTQKYQARYDETLKALTLVIHTAATAPMMLPSLAAPVVFDELPGVFDNPGAYNVGIATLHDNGARWELRPGITVRRVVEAMAAKESIPWRAIKTSHDIEETLLETMRDREAIVVIADEKSVSGGAWKARLGIVDAKAGENCILLVGLQTSNGLAISSQDAQARLAALAPRLSAASRVEWFPADAPDTLQTRLAERVVMLRMALVKSDPAKRVIDEGLVQDALDAQGLAVGARPSVSGPAGVRP